MKTTVKKEELLEKVKAAREDHKKQYEEALRGWVESMREAAARVITRVEKGVLKAFPKEFRNLMRMPSLHIGDYDQAIAMLEMSVEDVIELDPEDFDQLVLGNWMWMEEFVATNALYSNRADAGDQ